MDNLNNLCVPVKERIFALLKSKSIQQKDFAKAIGVNAVTITDWKKGKSTSFMKKLTPIAKALGTSEVWLLTGKYTSQAPGAVETMEEIADSEGIHLVDLIGAGEGLDQYDMRVEKIVRKDGGELTPEDRGRIDGALLLGHRHAADRLSPEDKKEYLGMFDNRTLLRNLAKYCRLKGVSIETACAESGAGENFLGEDSLFAPKLQMLAQYLGVTTSELLGEVPISSDPGQAARDALTEQLAQSVRVQLSEEKKPIPADGDRLIMESAIRLHNWFHSLPLEKQKALLELGGGPGDLAE